MEKWTNKKCGEVIFDSNKDNWNQNTSVFNEKIQNRSNLAFIVEDEQKNKFGYFLSTQIQLTKYDAWISTDTNTFLFSLKSNGRLKGMMKFEIKNTNNGYFLRTKSESPYLIHLGGGAAIGLAKENSKGSSYCYQNNSYFDYHGTENPLVGGSGSGDKYFTPKRITVIQMK